MTLGFHTNVLWHLGSSSKTKAWNNSFWIGRRRGKQWWAPPLMAGNRNPFEVWVIFILQESPHYFTSEYTLDTWWSDLDYTIQITTFNTNTSQLTIALVPGILKICISLYVISLIIFNSVTSTLMAVITWSGAWRGSAWRSQVCFTSLCKASKYGSKSLSLELFCW